MASTHGTLHLTSTRTARLHSQDSRNLRVAACAEAFMRGFHRDKFKPGGPEIDSVMFCQIAHLGGIIFVHRAIRPDAWTTEILQLLRWLLEQKSLLVSGAFLQGHVLKSIVLLCDSLGDDLPEELRAAVLECLTTRMIEVIPNGLAPTLDMPGTGFHMLDVQVNNWDSLGSMGLIYAALLSEKVHGKVTPDARRWLAIADRRFRRFMRHQFTPEGEYGEGPGYYGYGGSAPMLILDLMSLDGASRTLGALTGYNGEELNGMYNSADWSRQTHPRGIELGPFNFNDCTSGGLESPCIVQWIASQTRNPAHQAYADRLFDLRLDWVEADIAAGKWPGDQDVEYLCWSLLFRDPQVPSIADETPLTRHYGRFGTVISRTGYTDRDLCLILRCGQAAGAHSHCDAGTFILEAFGERIVAEGGKPLDRSIPEYMAYHRRSLAHNVSFVDGKGQVREQEGKWFDGKITDFQAGNNGFVAVCDLSDVYLTGRKVTRRFTFSHDGWILVHDTFGSQAGSHSETKPPSVTTLLHTDHRDRTAQIELDPAHTVIRRPRAIMHVYPLISSGIRDTGTHFHDSDPEGLRSLEITGIDGEVAYLLVVVPAVVPSAGNAKVVLTKAGPRAYVLKIGDKVSDIVV